jgi:hypothetical protein
MTAVAFDTLKLARRLEGAGFTREQADGAAEALADSFSNEIATKGDIAELRMATKGDIAELRMATTGDIAELRMATTGDIAELRTAIAGFEGKLESKIGALEGKMESRIGALEGKLSADIASVRSSTAQWIITAVFINTAGLIGAIATVWQLAHK